MSADWLVVRAVDPSGRQLLFSLPLPALAPATLVAGEPSAIDLGRPAIDGNLVVAAVNGPLASKIVEFNLVTHGQRVLRSSRSTQLLNPARRGDGLLYVRASYCEQRLVLGSASSSAAGRTLLRLGGVSSRDEGREPGRTSQGSEPSRCPKPGRRGRT